MNETEKPETELQSAATYLKWIAADIKIIRQQSTEMLQAMREAEKEIPEKMRRFMNYFHDVVHVKGEYVSLGLRPPEEIDKEMERNHDRARQILHDLHSDGGHFEKVRREMTNHPVSPRFDHTRTLAPPKEKP